VFRQKGPEKRIPHRIPSSAAGEKQRIHPGNNDITIEVLTFVWRNEERLSGLIGNIGI
jgi:hypothetical protein